MFLVLGGLAAAGGAYYYFFKKDVRDAKAKLDGKAAEIKTKVNYAIDDAKDAASRKIEGAKATVKEAAGNAAEQSSQYADAAAKKARDSLSMFFYCIKFFNMLDYCSQEIDARRSTRQLSSIRSMVRLSLHICSTLT